MGEMNEEVPPFASIHRWRPGENVADSQKDKEFNESVRPGAMDFLDDCCVKGY